MSVLNCCVLRCWTLSETTVRHRSRRDPAVIRARLQRSPSRCSPAVGQLDCTPVETRFRRAACCCKSSCADPALAALFPYLITSDTGEHLRELRACCDTTRMRSSLSEKHSCEIWTDAATTTFSTFCEKKNVQTQRRDLLPPSLLAAVPVCMGPVQDIPYSFTGNPIECA